MADLAGVAAGTLELAAADDDAGTHADLAGQVDEVLDTDTGTAQVLGQGAEVGVVAQHGHADRADAARTRILANGTSCQPRLGASRTSPSSARMMPGTPSPDADQGGAGLDVA